MDDAVHAHVRLVTCRCFTVGRMFLSIHTCFELLVFTVHTNRKGWWSTHMTKIILTHSWKKSWKNLIPAIQYNTVYIYVYSYTLNNCHLPMWKYFLLYCTFGNNYATSIIIPQQIQFTVHKTNVNRLSLIQVLYPQHILL